MWCDLLFWEEKKISDQLMCFSRVVSKYHFENRALWVFDCIALHEFEFLDEKCWNIFCRAFFEKIYFSAQWK